MGYHLTRQQLEKESARMSAQTRIWMCALGQNGLSPARKQWIMMKLEADQKRGLECAEQLDLVNMLVQPIHEQGQDVTQDKLTDAQQRGDMGGMARQRPGQNMQQKREAENPLAKELQLSPELAERIQKLLKSGDDKQIEKGLEQGKKAPGKKDAKTSKMTKVFEEKMKQFKKLHKQMVTSLKKLHHSDSVAVKASMHDIKRGRIADGMRGLKGVSRTGGFQNETAKAAKDLIGSIEGMYKLAGLDTMMIFRREFKETANQPNWNAPMGKTQSDMRMDSATERADSLDKCIADIASGKADDKQKRTAVTAVGAWKAGAGR